MLLTMSKPNKVYVCDPAKNIICKKDECYIYGGMCCLTYNQDHEADFVKGTTIDALTPFAYGDRLPNILRRLYSQNKQSI